MTQEQLDLKYEKAPLVYVSYRLDISLTGKGREALSIELQGLAENQGFVVARPPTKLKMVMVDDNEVSHKASLAYCFFMPGENTQIIVEPTPNLGHFKVRLNTAVYETYEEFQQSIVKVQNILKTLDDSCTVQQAEIVYVDASIPAPEAEINEYLNANRIEITLALNSQRKPVVTHSERYPAHGDSPDSMFQFSAIPLPPPNSNVPFRFFPDELTERSEFSMQLVLPIQWAEGNESEPPTSSHFWTLITRAAKRYPSVLISNVDLVSDGVIIKNECKKHFTDLTNTPRTEKEWCKTSKSVRRH